MKWALLFLMSAKLACAGELIVIFPAESIAGDGMAVVHPFAEVDFKVEPKMEVMQEGQIAREIYKDIPAGKYRVRYGSMGPIGWVESYMETHVTIAKGQTKTVYLFRPESNRPAFPRVILDAMRAAKKKQPRFWVELEAGYEGASEAFLQYRDLGGRANPEKFIHYLRTDAEYTLRVQGLDGVGLLYEVKFKVEDPPPAKNPFAAPNQRKFVIEK